MATGKEPVNAGNAKAFYELLKNGGVSEGFIKDLQALRKAMGLGDTLGKVPMDCLDVALADSVDDSTIGQNMAVTPKGVYEYMMHKEGGTANAKIASFSVGASASKTNTASFGDVFADGECVAISGSSISVSKGGFYEISLDGTSFTVNLGSDKASPEFALDLYVGSVKADGFQASKTKDTAILVKEYSFNQASKEVFVPEGGKISIKVTAKNTANGSFTTNAVSIRTAIKRI